MKKRITFEPVHYFFPREGIFESERIIDGKKYAQANIDARAAARYYYHHSITRLINTFPVEYSEEQIRMANSFLEKFFNSNKEYLLDSKGNTHTPNLFTNLFAPKEKEEYIVLPTNEQFEDILGLGLRAVKRGTIKSIFSMGSQKIEEVCEKYAEQTNWQFPIARKNEDKTCGKITLKLSSRGARFSID
jgi:hypothetical protein